MKAAFCQKTRQALVRM